MTLSKRQYQYVDFTSMPYAPAFSAAAGSIAAVTKDITVAVPLLGGQYIEMTAKTNNFSAAPFVLPTATGWTIPTPATAADDNTEISGGILAGVGAAFVVGTSPAFFVRAKFKCTTQNKQRILGVGFRTQAAYAASGAATAAGFGVAYNDLAFVGIIDATAAGVVKSLTRAAGGAATLTAATKAAVAATDVVTFQVNVSAAGVVTYLINGAADTLLSAASFTLTGTPTVMPCVVTSIAGAAAGDALLQELEWGLQ